MQVENSITAQRLLKVFMQFNRAMWHQRPPVEGGYKHSEIRVLMCIRKSLKHTGSELKVSDISKMLHVTSPTVTQLIKGLEANGLVERNTDLSDRRVVGITLTEKGEQVTEKAMEAFVASFNGLIEYLGEEESEQLAELLGRVYTYFNEKEMIMNQSPWNGEEEA